jgi:hypothetical protein
MFDIKKILWYILSFMMMFTIAFFATFLLYLISLLIVSFIVWSPPLISPFTWGMLRALIVISTFVSLVWSFSKENQEFVQDCLQNKERN